MLNKRTRYGSEYKPPAIDSAQAMATAKMFLVSARSIDRVTVDWLARQYRLSPKRAESELSIETQRRASRADQLG